MADSGDFDPGQLSASQQAALQQYTDVTSQDIKDAVPLLERSQWNVQIAIAKFFDGEAPDPVAEAMAAQNTPFAGAQARHENLQESLFDSAHPARQPQRPRTDLAPRVVPQLPSTYRPPFLLAILLTPFQLGYRAISTVFRSVLYLLSFLPRPIRPGSAVTRNMRKGWRNTNGRRMLMPRDTAARFRREFEEEYGQGLPWFDGGHAQALDAAKTGLKFLLIVLMSPEHDLTESFTRETLLSPEVVAFLSDPTNNVILWGGNMLDSEAYQVSLEYSCTKFPFSALVCLTPKDGAGGGASSTRMGIVKRLAGPVTPETFLAGIRTAITKYAPDLDAVRAERAANDFARNLRTEQDSAYERSLARDRERARQRREAEAAAAAEEKAALDRAAVAERLEQNRQQWRRWRAASVPAEPPAGEGVRLALNMPASLGAGRVIRRFGGGTTLEELYAFVECYDTLRGAERETAAPAKPEDYEHKYAFRIASVMPRETFEPSSRVTVGEKMGRGGNLIVEDTVADEGDGQE